MVQCNAQTYRKDTPYFRLQFLNHVLRRRFIFHEKLSIYQLLHMFITLDLTDVYGQTKIEIPKQKNLLILQACYFFQGRRKDFKFEIANRKQNTQGYYIQNVQCRTHEGYIPNSLWPNFKSQSQINIRDLYIKAQFFVKIMIE